MVNLVNIRSVMNIVTSGMKIPLLNIIDQTRDGFSDPAQSTWTSGDAGSNVNGLVRNIVDLALWEKET